MCCVCVHRYKEYVGNVKYEGENGVCTCYRNEMRIWEERGEESGVGRPSRSECM